MEIQETKRVWVAWTNTDCTEGRGRQVPLHVAESYEAAVRLGRKGSVQGCDCTVTESVAVKVANQWLVPGQIQYETKGDKALRLLREKRDAAIDRAKAAGLSDDDIAALVR